MNRNTGKLGVSLAVVVAVGTLWVVAARGLDENSKLVEWINCSDHNATSSRFSPRNCIEGHECVVCITDLEIAAKVDLNGSGPKMQSPRAIFCGSERFVGYCTGTGSGLPSEDQSICDLSAYWIDGTCSGTIHDFDFQAF